MVQELSSAQRRFLRSEAHRLEPVVLVGKGGATETLVGAVNMALEAHELIKVKFNDFKDQKEALLQEIEEKTGAARCGLIGHVAILYRQHPDADKRKIDLPR